MSIEYERKSVLNPQTPENVFQDLCQERWQIRQGYLLRTKTKTARIRTATNQNGDVFYWFTFKQEVAGKTVEIERKITQQDYDMLATRAKGWLTKTRYCIDGWEVDFFKDNNEVYFVVAEIELPDGVEEPDAVPNFVSDYCVSAIAYADNRLVSNKKLSSIPYAKKVLAKLQADEVKQIQPA